MSTTEMEKENPPSVDSATDSTRVDLYFNETVDDPVYQAKAHVLNQAIQEIGMGKYQWYLFVVAGFGWIADSGALVLVGNIIFPLLGEYHFKPAHLSLAMAIGFFTGVFIWGFSIDIWGRRYVFNITLLIGGAFGVASGGANSFVTLASLVAVIGLGVSGNIPVDSIILLDFLPGSHQYLLTAANAFWGVGLMLFYGTAWALIPKYSCGIPRGLCPRSQNMGWRYYCFTTGGLSLFLWVVRFAIPLLESPRYLLGKGQNEEAVKVVHRLAKINGKTSSLTVEQLLLSERKNSSEPSGLAEKRDPTLISAAFRHLSGLFATPKMARSTVLLFMISLCSGISLALYFTFMPYIIATRGAKFGDGSLNTSYRNLLIQTAIAIPGPLLGGYLVEIPFLGRKRVLVIFLALAGIALLGTTTAKTSNQLLGWNIAYSFVGSIGYASMNAIGQETYHGQHRGTGTALQATGSRFASIMGALIALHADLTTAVPVYIAGALTICTGLLALFLPYEPRGHSSI